MLIFAAITPNSPMLIPAISKENIKYIEKTINAIKKLEDNLYAAQPECIVIITPNEQLQADSFTINVQDNYEIRFDDFGDFSTKLTFRGDPTFAGRFKEHYYDVPVALISNEKLSYGAGVPLYSIAKNLKNVRIVPIGYSHLSLNLEIHYQFGTLLRKEIETNNKRIAVIASGNLSHTLTKDAPAGYFKEGKIFDQKLLEYLKEKKTDSILKFDKNLIDKAHECCLGTISILLGILNELNYKPKLLSYESPFGVGYLVMDMGV